MENIEKIESLYPAEKRLDRLLKLHIKMQELIDKFPSIIPSKFKKKIVDKLFGDEQLQELINNIKENKIPPSEVDKTINLAAERFTKVFSSLAFIIGTEPIPGPDILLLLPLQTMLISLIAFLSGRDLNKKTAGEFLTSVGVNVGAGFVFREAARGLVKLFAGPGNLISGGVAASGTYAIGKAAIGYYLEGINKEDIKKIFVKAKKNDVKKLEM
jgi:uncharacterized protein (DUF697 family)